MSERRADVVVVGGGVMGAAAARSIARRGRDVVLLERFELGHTRGSSHGASRIFRFSYDDPTFARMAMDALPLWRELEAETGERLLHRTGGLDTGGGLERHAAALEAVGAPYEWIDAAEVARRYPDLALPDGDPALFQPDAGIVAAEPAWRALARSAVGSGARVLERTPAIELRAVDDGVEVRTNNGSIRATTVVVTAGSWARGLLAPLGIELPVRVTRETVAYCRVEDEMRLPSLVEWLGPPYFFSLGSPGQGLKIGRHMGGPETDPDLEGVVSPETVERIAEWVAKRFPRADPRPYHAETCLYTITPDEGFVLERHGAVVIGSPCSGHGFKFAPLIGERLADLVG